MLYIMDISEQCGHTLAEQAALFHSIKPLFANKPLLIVANKTDVTSIDSLSPEDKALLDEMVSEAAKMSGEGLLCRSSGIPTLCPTLADCYQSQQTLRN